MIGPFWQAKAGCNSQAALSSNDSKMLYSPTSSQVIQAAEAAAGDRSSHRNAKVQFSWLDRPNNDDSLDGGAKPPLFLVFVV